MSENIDLIYKHYKSQTCWGMEARTISMEVKADVHSGILVLVCIMRGKRLLVIYICVDRLRNILSDSNHFVFISLIACEKNAMVS